MANGNINDVVAAFNSQPDFEVALVTIGIPPEKIKVQPGTTVGQLKTKLGLGSNVKIVIKTGSSTSLANDSTVITAGMELYKETAKKNG